MSNLGPISHFLSPVSCDLLVLQGLRCEWGAGVFNLVLSLSLSHTGHWKFNMAPHGKELSEDLKKELLLYISGSQPFSPPGRTMVQVQVSRAARMSFTYYVINTNQPDL